MVCHLDPKFEDKLIKLNNQLVLLDKDVAFLYEIEPKKLRQQIKRNIEKFPKDYAYQVSDEELELMGSQNVTPSMTQRSNKILEEIIDIEPDILEDEEDGEIIETQTKFEFNLGFAKVSRSIKKIKK